MGLNMIFLCTTVGALVGTIVGILLMNRKVRLPVTGADLSALRNKLQAAESSLVEAKTTGEDLRKQLAGREEMLRRLSDDLKQKQEQLDRAAAEAEKNKLQRSVSEQLTQELGVQNSSLVKQRDEFESSLEEARKQAAEKSSRAAFLESELETEKRRVEELSGQVDGLIAERAASLRFREQESRRRADLETQLTAEQERARQLAAHVAELEIERSRFDRKLQEERESAARGMELLLKAQENFSQVLNPANGEIRNGEIRRLPIEPAADAKSPGALFDGVRPGLPVD